MSNFSRRIFLILLGALATSGVAQSSDAATTKKPTPTPTPKKTTAKKPTPTPTPKKTTAAPKKPTPSPTTKKPTPTPTATQSKVVEGIYIAKSSDLRTSNGIFAFETRCTHAGVPTSLSGSQLKCPAHGSVFNPETGEVVRGPATEPLKRYRTVEANGEIRIITA